MVEIQSHQQQAEATTSYTDPKKAQQQHVYNMDDE